MYCLLNVPDGFSPYGSFALGDNNDNYVIEVDFILSSQMGYAATKRLQPLGVFDLSSTSLTYIALHSTKMRMTSPTSLTCNIKLQSDCALNLSNG